MALFHSKRSLTSAGVLTFGFNGLTLAVTLVTGVLVARTLGPTGRGQLAAITTMPNLIGWVFAMGCARAASFHQARHPADGGRLLSTWALLLVPFTLVAIGVGVLTVPIFFHAQDAETIRLGQLFMVTVILVLAGELAYGMLLGDHDFTAFNVARFAQPSLTAVGYVILWSAGVFSVPTALATTAFASLVVVGATWLRVLRRHGLGPPDTALARNTLSYGLRVHGDNIGGVLNARLDLVIMPAFLGAASVGLYSVATNLSSVVVVISAALAVIVLPAAARQDDRAVRTVVLSLQATLIAGVLLAAAVAVGGDLLIKALYGARFQGSLVPLLLLLPGSVLIAGASILVAGLAALDRPLTASAAQGLGLLVTVPGLLLFLPSGGVDAAAVVSTVSYFAIFVTAFALYCHASGQTWRRFLSLRDLAVRSAASLRSLRLWLSSRRVSSE